MAAVSTAAGLNKDTLGKVLKQRHSSPTIETVEKLANGLGRAPAYLAFGVSAGGSGADAPPARGLPILGFVETGIWVEAEARDDAEERVPIAPDIRFPVEAQYVLMPRGTSMNRVFGQGDLIHCVDVGRGHIEAREGDVVIVERRRMNGEVETSAKRLTRIDGQRVAVPDSTDDRWANVRLALDDADEGETITITAVVIRVVRELLR